MLWYKAWLETRLRFLICVIGLTGLCVYEVIRTDHGITSPVNAAYYYLALHDLTRQLAIFLILAVNLTTAGGLLREKAVGSASFTLALPFSRAHQAAVRIAVGLLETLAIIAMPWAGIFVTGSFAPESPPVSQALLHLAFLSGGGLVYFSIAVLASSLVEGEYIAPVISFGVVVLMGSILDGSTLRVYNPGNFMMGGSHYRIHEGLLVGPFPGAQIAIYCAISLLMIAISVEAIQRREF